MAETAGHLSNDQLADFGADECDSDRVRAHLTSCPACGQRREDFVRVRELLAATGHSEHRLVRNAVPSAMMRLRLRRHSVTNANEVFEGFAALMRGLASLFSLPPRREVGGRTPRLKDEYHE